MFQFSTNIHKWLGTTPSLYSECIKHSQLWLRSFGYNEIRLAQFVAIQQSAHASIDILKVLLVENICI